MKRGREGSGGVQLGVLLLATNFVLSTGCIFFLFESYGIPRETVSFPSLNECYSSNKDLCWLVLTVLRGIYSC